MTEVLAAQDAYQQARADALVMRARARAQLGRSVVQQSDRGSTLEAIAKELGKATEQVRRYRQAYWDWMRDHDGQEP